MLCRVSWVFDIVVVVLTQPPDAPITLTVKSARPPLTLSIAAHPSDSVTDLKARVAAAPGAPPADAQRLLLKGKVLADAKLLKEYDLADGAVLTLMAKPGAKVAKEPTPPPVAAAAATPAVRAAVAHDLPQLTITTDSPGAGPTDVPEYQQNEQPSPALSTAAFHAAIANPDFWQKLHALAQTEFASRDDADYVLDTFLVAMKGRLSATEAAKIRDVVGVAGECARRAVPLEADELVLTTVQVWAAACDQQDSSRLRARLIHVWAGTPYGGRVSAAKCMWTRGPCTIIGHAYGHESQGDAARRPRNGLRHRKGRQVVWKGWIYGWYILLGTDAEERRCTVHPIGQHNVSSNYASAPPAPPCKDHAPNV